ncbi:MAG: Mur ligase domain-containing protein, partial [Bacteroidales bacterium]
MIYSIKEIAEILQLSLNDISDYNISVLLTDSRSLTFPEETLFFAIKTLRNDGHRFIPELYRKGVRNFVVNKVDEVWRGFADVNFLETDDVSGALQRITAEHRGRFDIPIVGVTGSNGKTVVKEWLYQLLRNDYNITRSPRSYNSQIG